MTISGTQSEGTVFDLGYRRYEGPREGRNRARTAVYIDGLKITLGIGRGGRAKEKAPVDLAGFAVAHRD